MGLGRNKNVGGLRGVGGGMSTSRARASSIKKVKSKVNNPSKTKPKSSTRKIMEKKATAYALRHFSSSNGVPRKINGIPRKKDRFYKGVK